MRELCGAVWCGVGFGCGCLCGCGCGCGCGCRCGCRYGCVAVCCALVRGVPFKRMHRRFKRSDHPHRWPSILQHVCIAFTHTLHMHMNAHTDLQPWLALTTDAAAYHAQARLRAELPWARPMLSSFQKHHGTIAQGIATLAHHRFGAGQQTRQIFPPTYVSVTPATVLPEPSFAVPFIAIARTRNRGGLANRLRRTHGQTAQGPRPLQPTLCAHLPHPAFTSAPRTKLHMYNKQKSTQSSLCSRVLSKCLRTLWAMCTPPSGVAALAHGAWLL